MQESAQPWRRSRGYGFRVRAYGGPGMTNGGGAAITFAQAMPEEHMNIREVPQQAKPRYGIDPYLDWLKGEGIPVIEDYSVYLFDVKTAPWPRYGVNGAAVHLKGRGDFANMFVFEVAAGQLPSPRRHL